MHSTEVQAKPLFSWKALGWALLYFWFFSTLLQAIIYISGYSGTNGIRDSLLFSSLWLIPVFLFPKRIKIIAAVIGVVLWAASLAALCYYIIYGQEFSQSVLFVMFETNTNEASEYLSQYFSLKIVLIALAYTAVAVLLWTRLRPVYIDVYKRQSRYGPTVGIKPICSGPDIVSPCWLAISLRTFTSRSTVRA